MKKDVAPRDSWITLGPGQKVYLDEKLAKSWQDQRKALREIRGNILAASIEIELILDQIINESFYPKDAVATDKVKAIKKLFDQFILKERPMTLNSKLSLFRKLCTEHHLLADEKLDDLVTNLDKIRDTRNRFAHNTLAFFPEGDIPNQKLTPKLTCHDTEIILNNQYFDTLNELYKTTHMVLENLLKKFSK